MPRNYKKGKQNVGMFFLSLFILTFKQGNTGERKMVPTTLLPGTQASSSYQEPQECFRELHGGPTRSHSYIYVVSASRLRLNN
jgi:hypothetical protein